METKQHEGCCEPQEAQAQPKDLESLKKEILGEINQNKPVQKRKINWASASITSILVILMIVSITQAFQMVNIWGKIKSGAIKPASAGSAASAPLPSSIQNLPNMVGGC